MRQRIAMTKIYLLSLHLSALTGIKKEKFTTYGGHLKSQSAYSPPQKLESHNDIRVEFTGKNLTKFGGVQPAATGNKIWRVYHQSK
jgi:hypothetical protein